MPLTDRFHKNAARGAPIRKEYFKHREDSSGECPKVPEFTKAQEVKRRVLNNTNMS